jgi:hypothetical protein
MTVGTSVAKAFAEATAHGSPVAPAPSQRPLDALIHYGVAAVTNVMGMVAAGVGTATGTSPPTTATPAGPVAAPSSVSAGGRPTVQCGGCLRVPLSVENSTAQAMERLAVACRSLTSNQPSPARPLSPGDLRFEPEILTIGARDFEKLTVRVSPPADSTPGTYQAVIAIGPDGFEIRLVFDVVAPTQTG